MRWTGHAHRLTVIVKATLALTHDRAWLVHPQPGLSVDRESALSRDELAEASDFAPFKPRADVLLIGAAYAEEATRSIAATVAIGALRREFYALASEPATAIPLSASYLRAGPLHEDLTVTVAPLPPYARAARREGDGEYDWGIFNAAPVEQQVEILPEGGELELVGLLRGAPRCRVSLPPMRPRVHLVDYAARRVVAPVTLFCDTLVIDTDRSTGALTWRGVIDIPPETATCLLVTYERADAASSEEEVLRNLEGAVWSKAAEAGDAATQLGGSVRLDGAPGAANLSAPEGSSTTEAPRSRRVPTAPFQIEPAPPSAGDALPFRRARSGLTATLQIEEPRARVDALPFARVDSPPSFVDPPRTDALPFVQPEASPLVAIEPPAPVASRDEISIETYAAVQAELWAKRGSLADVLAPHGLDEPTFRIAARRLLHQLSAEASAGKSERLVRLSSEIRRRTARNGGEARS